MITLLIIISVLFLICIISSVLTLIEDYKYYKKTYNELPNLTFTKAYNTLYNQVASTNGSIIWFANKNSFKIGPNNYIHNTWYTYINPYALYWFYKYKKWFNKNCNHLKKDK